MCSYGVTLSLGEMLKTSRHVAACLKKANNEILGFSGDDYGVAQNIDSLTFSQMFKN